MTRKRDNGRMMQDAALFPGLKSHPTLLPQPWSIPEILLCQELPMGLAPKAILVQYSWTPSSLQLSLI